MEELKQPAKKTVSPSKEKIHYYCPKKRFWAANTGNPNCLYPRCNRKHQTILKINSSTRI